MRAALTAVLLLVIAAPAAARPLDPDRGFARAGIFRLDEPDASTSVIALRDGGTLHATDKGLMRLSARGRLDGFTAGVVAAELTPGMAVGATRESGRKVLLETWPLDADGRPGERRLIELRRSAYPVRVVRRRGGFAVLVHASGAGLRLVALTRDGALDTTWGEEGARRVSGDYEDLAIAGLPDGSVVHASMLKTRCDRRGFRAPAERAVMRVQRYRRDGTAGPARRFAVGAKVRCPRAATGEALVDSRNRVLVAGEFANSAMIVRLRSGLRRDRTFTAVVRRDISEVPVRIERAPRGGYVLGYTAWRDQTVPSAQVALFDRRGRRRALRRLKVTRNYPTSDLLDLAVDRRGGLIGAGSLRDTDVFIREDYGFPHLAVWRVRRR